MSGFAATDPVLVRSLEGRVAELDALMGALSVRAGRRRPPSYTDGERSDYDRLNAVRNELHGRLEQVQSGRQSGRSADRPARGRVHRPAVTAAQIALENRRRVAEIAERADPTRRRRDAVATWARSNTGSYSAAPGSASRAVLADALKLVRVDRPA